MSEESVRNDIEETIEEAAPEETVVSVEDPAEMEPIEEMDVPPEDEPAEEPQPEQPEQDEPQPEQPEQEQPQADEPEQEEPQADEPEQEQPEEESHADEPAKEPEQEQPAKEPKPEEPSKEPKAAEADDKPVRKPSRLVTALIVLLILVVVAGTGLTVVYFVGRDYFRTHFMYNTTVNGADVSKMDMNQIMASIKDKYPTTFVIKEKEGVEESIDFSATITNDDIDRFVESQKEKAVTWYESLYNETSFTSSDKIEIKEDDFKSLVRDALNSVERTPSKDAFINIEEMTIVPEEIGNEIHVDEICEKAYEAADQNIYEVSVDEKEYIHPAIYRDDESLTSVIAEYEQKISRSIDISVTGAIHRTIPAETLKEWITYDGKQFQYNEEQVHVFTEELAYDYDTAYSEREFKTSKGKTVKVGRGENDTYAGWLLDEEETYNNILDAVESDSAEAADVVWILQGYALDETEDGLDDIGGTYIEISVPDQHMWYYEDHKLLMDTDVVTGLESNPERKTPRGLFYLLEMRSPFVMHGDYGQQPCQFFIRITWDGVAIHDADWQSAFGGDRYLTAGSHGCINTPYPKVSALWDYLDVLDDWQVPVIIY